jgi:NAD(P)-dependent dehydrogenase (short-subunit alcohol dehydrogenase family)
MAEPLPNDRLAERIVLVTGAAEGLGRALALAAAAAGATLVLSDRDQGHLESLYDAILAQGGPEPAILPLDPETADADTCGRAADLVGDCFGRLDGLVHCAAFAPFLGRIDDYEPSEWERVLRINLTAPFLLTQACLPLLRASDDAAVIFTSDRVGRSGKAYWGAFAAAKFGIEGLAQVLADETRGSSRIRVSCIDPGILRTGLRARLYPGEDPSTLPGPETAAPRYLELLAGHPIETPR